MANFVPLFPPLIPDPNHKPEMAIALTPFKAFLNFLPLPSLLLNLLSTPELDTLIPFSLTSKLATSLTLPNTRPPTSLLFSPTQAAPTDEQKEILKEIFGALMNAKEDDVKAVIKQLLERWQNGDVKENEVELVELVKTLNEQYPEDIGVLCVFILNVVELKKGEAAFLGADMPHAYISGGGLVSLLLWEHHASPRLRQISSNAWRPPTTSFELVSRRNCAMSPHWLKC